MSSLLHEAGYLYKYSKELLRLNRKLKKYGKLAEKHKRKHGVAKEKDKPKHLAKHSKTMEDVHELMKRHNRYFGKLRYHYLRFAHHFRKEHKI
ncbi:hypothetical protein HQ489_05660 [Candidatus Woesearchaeota archaeon]|nr:hypothetical protein [Candidatus Woesearchaeota archaeon]